jgi:hypothetical protein
MGMMAMARTMGVPDSLRRCLASPGFVVRFLTLLADRVPRDTIAGCPIDPGDGSLRFMTGRCLTTLVLAVSGHVRPGELGVRFGECGAGGGLPLTAAIYPIWSECLVAALREYDPHMDAALAADWRETLAAGARLLEPRT